MQKASDYGSTHVSLNNFFDRGKGFIMKKICCKLLIALLVFTLLGVPMPSPVHADMEVECSITDENGNTVPIPCEKGGILLGIIIAGVAVVNGVIWVFKKIANALDKDVFRDKNDAYLFREGNNCTQQLVGSLGTTDQPPGRPGAVNAKQIPWLREKEVSGVLENDEARSVIIQQAAAGEVLRAFDNPDGSRKDDWTEIIILRDIDINHPYCVGSFEGPKSAMGKLRVWSDDFILLVHHHVNGLDGKISRVENDRVDLNRHYRE